MSTQILGLKFYGVITLLSAKPILLFRACFGFAVRKSIKSSMSYFVNIIKTI